MYSDDNLHGPAQIGMQRALCLVRIGDTTEGTLHALDTITNLPLVHRIRPIVDLGQKVFDSIPAHERNQTWAKEYDECLGVSFPGQVRPNGPGGRHKR